MASRFMRFLQKLLGPKEVRHLELDPESIKKHHEIKSLAYENAELKGELGRVKSELGELRESEKDLKEEDEVKIELDRQSKEIRKKNYPKYFSLKAFFRRLARDKKGDLFFYDFQGSEKLGKFGDIGFSNGEIVLLDNKRNIITHGKNIQNIFWSVGGLETDIKAKKVPLCLDKDGGYVENPMVWEAAEYLPARDGKFKFSKARKKPFYEYIKELMGEIGEKQEYIEELELTCTGLQKQIDDLAVSERVSEDSAETSRAELGKAEKRVSSIERIFRGTERDLTQVRDINVILEENLTKLESQVESLREEAEREGVKLSDDKAMESIQNIRRELVRDEPEKEIKIIQAPNQPNQPTQPVQPAKK